MKIDFTVEELNTLLLGAVYGKEISAGEEYAGGDYDEESVRDFEKIIEKLKNILTD